MSPAALAGNIKMMRRQIGAKVLGDYRIDERPRPQVRDCWGGKAAPTKPTSELQAEPRLQRPFRPSTGSGNLLISS